MSGRILTVFITLLGLLSLAIPSAPAHAAVNEDERTALKALYAALDGDNWLDKTGWDTIDTATDLEPLYGITVNGSGRVIKLLMPRNNMIGTIPDLSAPDRTDSAQPPRQPTARADSQPRRPDQTDPLLSLGKRTRPECERGEDSHARPGQTSCPPAWSRSFSTTTNSAARCPTVNNLTNLAILYIRNNDLSGPLPDVSDLTALQHFSIRNNKLGTHADGTTVTDISGLADKLPTSLTQLWLSTNGLTGTLPDLSSFTHLTLLRLELNQLSGPLPDVNALTGLGTLNLSSNQFSGPLPDLSALASLPQLRLDDNKLGTHTDGTETDISGWQANLPPNLTHLYLRNNDLRGTIPDLTDLSSLQFLFLGGNQLTGPLTIPDPNDMIDPIDRISPLPSGLTELHLSNNKLGTHAGGSTTDISELGTLLSTSLTNLQLDNNGLVGTLPDHFRTLTRLQFLFLDHNGLTGIPDLSPLTRLTDPPAQRQQTDRGAFRPHRLQ